IDDLLVKAPEGPQVFIQSRCRKVLADDPANGEDSFGQTQRLAQHGLAARSLPRRRRPVFLCRSERPAGRAQLSDFWVLGKVVIACRILHERPRAPGSISRSSNQINQRLPAIPTLAGLMRGLKR